MSDYSLELFNAVEDFNTVVNKSPLKDTLLGALAMDKNTYLRGLFYTCLRRYIPDICRKKGRYGHADIQTKNLECTFNKDNTLKSVKINKTGAFNMCWDDTGLDKAYILEDIKKVAHGQKLYPTRPLNELAYIFSSL